MLLVSYIQQYFNTSITVLTNHCLKVADCTVQSAEYWCFYGTKKNNERKRSVLLEVGRPRLLIIIGRQRLSGGGGGGEIIITVFK